MRKIIKLSAVAVSMLLFVGCSAPKVDLSQNKDRKTEMAKTNYTQALQNVDSMIAVFNGRGINVVVNPIQDETASAGKLPRNISTMVKSTFNKIGNNVTTLSTLKLKKFPNKNIIYSIEGAITEFDLLEASGSGFDAAGEATYKGQEGTTDFSMDRESKLTKLAITFNPVNTRTGSFVPRGSTNNRITIDQKSGGNEFAISILGTGIGLNNAITKAHGVHSSIRILIELSVVELLGRVTNYPYWLLTGGEVNQDVVSNLSRKFVRGSLGQKIQKVSYLLALQGENVQTTSMMNSDLKSAIIKYKSAHGMDADDTIDSNLYMSLIGAS